MKSHEHDPKLIKQHITNKEAYDVAFGRDQEQQDAVNLAIEGIKSVHREANGPLRNMEDPADEEVMRYRRYKAADHLTHMVEKEADTEDEVNRAVRYATEDYEDSKDAIHTWALDEYEKATNVPVDVVEEEPVHVDVTVK